MSMPFTHVSSAAPAPAGGLAPIIPPITARLEGESLPPAAKAGPSLEGLVADFTRALSPQDGVEEALVAQMAAAHWQVLRLMEASQAVPPVPPVTAPAPEGAGPDPIAALYKVSLTLSRLNALFLRNLKTIRLRQEQRRKGLGVDGKPGDSRGTGGGRRETATPTPPASGDRAGVDQSTGNWNDKKNGDSSPGPAGAKMQGSAPPGAAAGPR